MRYLILLCILLVSCSQITLKPPAPSNPVKISWEQYPENKLWSDFAYNLLDKELFTSFDKAQDATQFCPKYQSLTRQQKIYVWVELLSTVSKYESSWKPATVFNEPAPLNYPSIGLLQLSYEDHAGYPYCPAKGGKDLKDPLVNLDCGMRILANQVNKKGKIILSSGVYWSTLKSGGTYSKIPQIVAMTKKLPYCL